MFECQSPQISDEYVWNEWQFQLLSSITRDQTLDTHGRIRTSDFGIMIVSHLMLHKLLSYSAIKVLSYCALWYKTVLAMKLLSYYAIGLLSYYASFSAVGYYFVRISLNWVRWSLIGARRSSSKLREKNSSEAPIARHRHQWGQEKRIS